MLSRYYFTTFSGEFNLIKNLTRIVLKNEQKWGLEGMKGDAGGIVYHHSDSLSLGGKRSGTKTLKNSV